MTAAGACGHDPTVPPCRDLIVRPPGDVAGVPVRCGVLGTGGPGRWWRPAAARMFRNIGASGAMAAGTRFWSGISAPPV